MKKYRDKMDEIYDDRGASKQDKRLKEDRREEKRMKNALRSKNYQNFLEEEEEDFFSHSNEDDF